MAAKTEREREIDAIDAELKRISRMLDRAHRADLPDPELRAVLDEAETIQRDCRRRVDALKVAA